MRNELIVIKPEILHEIQSLTLETSRALQSKAQSIIESLAIANGRMRLTQLIQQTPAIKNMILSLKGSPVGFRTDQDKEVKGKPYSEELIIECAVEAMMRGLQLHGNQFNIISERCYTTKEGLEHILYHKVDGFTNLTYTLNLPKRVDEKSAIVQAKAEWLMNGQKMSLGIEPNDQCLIPIKINSYATDDAILGKAQRKLFNRIYQRVSGVSMPDGDVESDGIPKEMGEAKRTDAGIQTVNDRFKPKAPEQTSAATEPPPVITQTADVPAEPSLLEALVIQIDENVKAEAEYYKILPPTLYKSKDAKEDILQTIIVICDSFSGGEDVIPEGVLKEMIASNKAFGAWFNRCREIFKSTHK